MSETTTTKPITTLLLGRKSIVVADAQARLDIPKVNLTILVGTNVDDVRRAFASESSSRHIDHVFMGAGIDLDQRLDIVRAVFELSDSTTVHMKDRATGPAGFLLFVQAVLEGVSRG